MIMRVFPSFLMIRVMLYYLERVLEKNIVMFSSLSMVFPRQANSFMVKYIFLNCMFAACLPKVLTVFLFNTFVHLKTMGLYLLVMSLNHRTQVNYFVAIFLFAGCSGEIQWVHLDMQV